VHHLNVNPHKYMEALDRLAEHIEEIREANAKRAAEWKARDDLCSTCGSPLPKVGGACRWNPTHPQ
jgi:hypothetical protein